MRVCVCAGLTGVIIIWKNYLPCDLTAKFTLISLANEQRLCVKIVKGKFKSNSCVWEKRTEFFIAYFSALHEAVSISRTLSMAVGSVLGEGRGRALQLPSPPFGEFRESELLLFLRCLRCLFDSCHSRRLIPQSVELRVARAHMCMCVCVCAPLIKTEINY